MNTGDLTYPASVSRTLVPDAKALIRVIGQHDRQLSDADINLLQDLVNLRGQQVLADTSTSGCATYQPYVFTPQNENTFLIPGFDVLLNGEIVHITGNRSSDLSVNKVVLPAPQNFQLGSTNQPAQIFIVFLELWYATLNPTSGAGYFTNQSGQLFYFPFGNTTPDPANQQILPNDTIDPFIGVPTTLRAQVQWAIRVQPVALSYDFTAHRFGLDPGNNQSETVYAQGGSGSPVIGNSIYQFTNMGGLNGDSGVWRAGDGNVNNSLISMDGYSYAMPLAVVFQRNSGTFSITSNPFGCGSRLNAASNSGLLASNQSGRFDSKFADSIFPSDVVDTRLTISLNGYDNHKLADNGFAQLVMGQTNLAIGRGQSPGNQSIALGSQLDYYVSLNPTGITNTDVVGSFDGFMNGFSSDERTFFSTQKVTVNQKTVGAIGSSWINGDEFIIGLPASSLGTISSVQVQILVTQQDGSKQPALLLPGQISVTGLNTKTVTIKFIINVTGTTFDPTSNDIYVTVGTDYPAGTGLDLRQIPVAVEGGQLIDGATGITLPVFGISEYAISVPQPALTVLAVTAVNPKFSNAIFGTRIFVQIQNTQGAVSTIGGNTTTTFIIPRKALDAISGISLDGLYPLRAFDFVTGAAYTVAARAITSTTAIVQIQGTVTTGGSTIFAFLANATCQISFNAPVKGVTEIEETVLIGNVNNNPNLLMDTRVLPVSVKNFINTTNVVVLAANGCQMKGISGDDVNSFIWVQDNTGNFNAVQISSASFQNGLVVVNVPPTVNLEVQPFFFCASILPALAPSSEFIIEESYIPYQGEGILNRDYEILYADDFGLITTNGTGAAPIVGLADVFPYNRQLPVSISLPTLTAWPDSTLLNNPVSSVFDSNFVGKQFENVENTFEVPLHTNDWIDSLNKGKTVKIRPTTQAGARGFNRATPNFGFAITPVTPKTALSNNVQATVAPIILFVNNVTGNDALDGLTANTAKQSIQSALNSLPPVLRHPCVIQIIPTGTPFLMQNLKASLQVIALGDGQIVSAKYYAIGNIAYTIQESGRLVISAQAGATSNVVIDAVGFLPFGDGPTSAFLVNDSRVIFNQITFQNFIDPAIKGIAANIEFVNCDFIDNVQAGSFEQGSLVVSNNCDIQLGNGSTGFVADQSEIVSSGTDLGIDIGAVPGVFYVLQRNSSLTLQQHGTDSTQESNIVATTDIVAASLNSNVVCQNSFQSNGSAALTVISALQRTVSINPFLGGVTTDSSSTVSTSLS